MYQEPSPSHRKGRQCFTEHVSSVVSTSPHNVLGCSDHRHHPSPRGRGVCVSVCDQAPHSQHAAGGRPTPSAETSSTEHTRHQGACVSLTVQRRDLRDPGLPSLHSQRQKGEPAAPQSALLRKLHTNALPITVSFFLSPPSPFLLLSSSPHGSKDVPSRVSSCICTARSLASP